MEKLEMLEQDTHKALRTLLEIIEIPYSIIVRDATIQRFAYSFEILGNNKLRIFPVSMKFISSFLLACDLTLIGWLFIF